MVIQVIVVACISELLICELSRLYKHINMRCYLLGDDERLSLDAPQLLLLFEALVAPPLLLFIGL